MFFYSISEPDWNRVVARMNDEVLTVQNTLALEKGSQNNDSVYSVVEQMPYYLGREVETMIYIYR